MLTVYLTQSAAAAATAVAKSLQLCPTLCDPIDSSPPGSPVPWILQARTLEWIAIFILQGNLPDPGTEPASPTLAGGFFTTDPPGKPFSSMKVKSLSRV